MVLLATVVCGCSTKQSNDAPRASVQHAVAGDSGRVCADSVEVRALACSGGRARRAGDTLFVRLVSGKDTAFVDDTGGEAPGGYHYAGWIAGPDLQLIQSWGHETYPSWIIMNARTGAAVSSLDEPVLSPDSTRFATAAEGWDNCSEGNGPLVEVWRLTDSIPVREWRLKPWDCGAAPQNLWGLIDPRWQGRDTLELTRIEFLPGAPADSNGAPQYLRRPVLAVHDRSGWKLLAPH